MAHDITLNLADEAVTLSLGDRLSRTLRAGQSIYLHGDLGAGKTTLVRGLLHGMGHVGKVKSPTYTLVEPYVISGLSLYHFDLYRFNDPEEWDAAGFRDYFNAATICLVEWPEKARELLPDPDIDIVLTPMGEGRQVRLTANTASGEKALDGLSHD
jgi:tRNA threonylcarbamoyladenosine biosynthesis protein TsaE